MLEEEHKREGRFHSGLPYAGACLLQCGAQAKASATILAAASERFSRRWSAS